MKVKFIALFIIAILSGFLPLLLLLKIEVGDFNSILVAYSLIIIVILVAIFWVSKKAKKKFHHIAQNENNNLYESIGDGFLRYDDLGEVCFISKSAKKLFNCENFELTGSGLVDRTHILDRPLYLTTIKNAQYNREKITINIRMRKDDPISKRAVASYIWVQIEFSPIIVNSKNTKPTIPYELIALLHDISLQKRQEEQLQSQVKSTQVADKEKSHFLAIMGHELRTPLNAIIGFSDMLASGIGGELKPSQQEYAELISQSGKHLVEIVNSLLDMAKMDAGKFELNVALFNLEELINHSLKIVNRLADEKNIKIEVKQLAQPPQILADQRACLQIIINLLSNAIKFSKPFSTIHLSVNRRGQNLEIIIKDQGIGMSEEHIARLGEPFLQADNSKSRNYEGTGLGIYIVKGLVDLHQGSLKVNSKINIGTNVRILLPIRGPKSAPQADNNIIGMDRFDIKKSAIINDSQQLYAKNNRKVAL